MNYFGKLVSNFKGFYNEINSATLTGALDVIVVQQEDGTLVCSPFHVRFGKLGVLHSREKIVDLEVNDEPVGLHMKLGEAGEAFFVTVAEPMTELPDYLATSPIPSSEDLMREGIKEMKKQRTSLPHSQSEGALDKLTLPNTEQRSRQDSEHSVRSQTDSERSIEFRPIIQDLSMTSTATDTSTTSVVSKPAAITPTRKTTSTSSTNSDNIKIENETQKDNNKRRKRKKHRKITKSQGAKTEDNNEIEELPDQEIFEIDVEGEEEESVMSTMGRTLSLPVIEEAKADRTDEWANSHYASQFHPFSDGDITPIMSPVTTRPPSPKSDTEYEKQMIEHEGLEGRHMGVGSAAGATATVTETQDVPARGPHSSHCGEVSG